MQVTILRGIPGSGKSRYVSSLTGTTGPIPNVCSADQFHIAPDGTYKFDPTKIGQAHDECLKKYLRVLHAKEVSPHNILFVDNTNLSSWELAPYVRLAEIFEVEYQILTLWVDPLVAAKRNIHRVPMERVFQMYQILLSERLPVHWKQKVMTL